jgi:hypothetical protein
MDIWTRTAVCRDVIKRYMAVFRSLWKTRVSSEFVYLGSLHPQLLVFSDQGYFLALA